MPRSSLLPRLASLALGPPDMRPVHITLRTSDWCAYRDPEGLCGYGRTEAEAIEELIAMEDDAAAGADGSP